MFAEEDFTMQTVTVSVSKHQAALIEQAVSTGNYASNSEVLRDAINLWEQHEQLRMLDIARLKQAYDEGIASGPVVKIDIEALLESFKIKALKRG